MILNPLSYLSPKVAVAKSPIPGRGLFAVEDLRVGEIVCVKGGHIFPRAILNNVAPVLGPAEIQIADDLFIGPIHPEEPEGCMVFSNHSCDPNIGVQGQIVFVALRHISAGEELTHDWAITDDDDYTPNADVARPNAEKLSRAKIGSERICSKNIAACSPGICSRRSQLLKLVNASRPAFTNEIQPVLNR